MNFRLNKRFLVPEQALHLVIRGRISLKDYHPQSCRIGIDRLTIWPGGRIQIHLHLRKDEEIPNLLTEFDNQKVSPLEPPLHCKLD